ncbi:MAG: sialidase family protein, partial [Acidobacteriota bacterium]
MTSARPRISLLSGISLLLLSLAASAAEPGATGASTSRLAWALKPEIFERLSPAARQSVLVANGLAPAPSSRREAASGVSQAASASALAAPAPRQNVRVNNPALDVDHHAARTSSVAARGSRVFVGFEDATWTAAGYGVSNDGGATFAHRRIPAAPDVAVWGSPSVAIGPAGEIYYAFLQSVPGDPASVALAKSTDGGLTFSELSSPAGGVENSTDVMDKPAIAVDNGASSPRKGTVYVVWTYYFTRYGYTAILCSHAADGASFTAPAILSIIDGAPVDHAAVAVAPNGDVYVAYQDGHRSPSGITITRSTDGGQSFGGLRAAATFQSAGSLTAGSGGAAPNSGPSLAVDGAGTVHIAWAAVSSGATSDRSDVFYVRSTDNGTTFSAARKLNDDGTPTTQAFPALAALPDGTVGVRWADRRTDAARDVLNDVTLAISRDGGVTWGRNIRVTDRNSPWGPAPHSLSGSGHASYDGLAADGGTFYVSWTDERSGDADVYAAAVPATFDASTPDFNLSALNTYAAVPQGGAATFDLAASGANGFAGTLALAPDLAPAGLTLSLASGTVLPGQTVRLSVTASASAPPGDYVFGVAATAGGLVRGTRMRLTVTNGARGFAPPVNVTRTPGFSTGSVKADGSGVLHSVTDDDSGTVTGSEVFYRRSTDGGATFSAPLKLHATGSLASESAFTIDAAGRIFVVWSGKVIADPTPRIYFVKSTDGGATFSAPLAVNGTTGYAILPNVVADRSGNLVVGWYDVSGDSPVVGWSRSTNAGTSFGTPVAVFDSPTIFTRPGVAIDSKNNAYLAWTQQTYNTSVIRLAVSKAGAAFGAPATVTDSATLSYAPDLAAGPDDSIGLAFYMRPIVANVIQNRQIAFARSTNGGASFSSPVFLSSAADQSYVPALVFESSGAIDVAWEGFDANDVQSDVRVARSTDG